MTDSKNPRVSVVIPALNEERHIEQSLLSILEGSLPPEEIEVIVADGGSTDRTREIITTLAEKHENLRLIDNPGKTAPSGFNTAIHTSRGDTICLHSGHGYLAGDYFERCLEKLDEGNLDAVGGSETVIAEEDAPQAKLCSAILDSRFGTGSGYRNVIQEGPTTMPNAPVYRRDVFERIGLFDTRLVRNQDNELASRLAAADGKMWLLPKARAFYYNRATVKGLLRQNFRNGLYGMLSWRINPSCFRLRHAIPLLFVLFLLIGTPLAVFVPGAVRIGVLSLMSAYAAVAVFEGARACSRHGILALIVLPPI
jgi:glycosyltransferase involved in cell wall biosynthesis